MAAPPPAPPAPSPPEDDLAQESSLHASLARLQKMHITLRHLRDTIPRVVTSLQSADNTPSPTELYAQFAYAATTAGKDIKGFMTMMRDERAREVFELVRRSREADGKGVEGWRVTEFEGWLNVDGGGEGRGGVGDGGEDDQGEGERREGKDESRAEVVRGFREGHPGVEVLIGDGVTLQLPPPANLHFFVVDSNRADLQEGLGVAANTDRPEELWKVSGVTNSSGKETKFAKSIQDAINDSKYKFSDLRSILEMVASYVDVTTKPCTKCSRLVDRTGQLPIIRNRKIAKQTDGRSMAQWLAFHKACT